MNERLLQFIWQFQYYNKRELTTSGGERLIVVKPGILNRHQGPDFSMALIRLEDTTWAGNVELHINASDWHRHRHAGDQRYSQIILHVVWCEDMLIQDPYGNRLPTLVLANRIANLLLDRYRYMMENPQVIPCASFLPAITTLAWVAWKERLAIERLERRSKQVLQQLQQCHNDWEEVCWQLLAANFGMRVNTVLFEQVAYSLPLRLLARHREQGYQLEALLMGQANLLGNKYQDAYPLLLQREYRFLRRKYHLAPVAVQPAFLRMRPASFPTIRFSQLAEMLRQVQGIFSTICQAETMEQLLQLFRVSAGEYWNDHYRFDEPAPAHSRQLGKQMAENIVINTVIILLYTYGQYHNDEKYKTKALQWLYQLAAEHNNIILQWQQPGITVHSALDSQALIELNNAYCKEKRCLECAVGNSILKGNGNDVIRS